MERPILFSGEMVRAILAGKTQTRRVVKPQPKGSVFFDGQWLDHGHGEIGDTAIHCPYGAVGDCLWVRESWRPIGDAHLSECVSAKDIMFLATAAEAEAAIFKWRPSIHMPRWACRIVLEITDVRVERLQDMEGQAPYPGESDALAEGVNRIHHGDGEYYFSAFRDEPHPKNWADPTDAFRELWDSINAKRAPWASNPYVWVISFKRLP